MAESIATIEKDTVDGAYHLIGQVDLNSVSSLRRSGDQLIDESSAKLTIDLERANFKGAGGLVLINAWQKYATQQQRQLTFVSIPESLSQVARAYGMLELLGLNESL